MSNKKPPATKPLPPHKVAKEPPEPPEPNVSSSGEVPSAKSRILPVLVLLMIGVMGGGAASFWQALTKLEEQQDSFQVSMRQQAATIEQRLQQVKTDEANQFENTQELLVKAQEQLSELVSNHRQLDKQVEHLAKLPALNQQEDWKLWDALSRLKLAQLTLQVEGNLNGAIALVKSAVEETLTFSSAGAKQIQHQLAKDLEKLQAIPASAPDELLNKLSRLARLMAEMKIKNSAESISAARTEVASIELNPDMSWKDYAMATLQELKHLVRIRKRDDALQPLFDGSQERLIIQNGQLIVHIAQVAVIRQEQTLYHQALGDFSNWLNHYFTAEGERVEQLQAEISSLQSVQLPTKGVSLEHSIEAVQSLIKQRQVLKLSGLNSTEQVRASS